MAHRVSADYTGDGIGTAPIKVYVRARPFEDPSASAEFLLLDAEQQTRLTIKDPEGGSKKKYSEVTFQFDNVFWTDTKQDSLFECVVQPQVDHVLNGYNCCCFAYGQTGSGKTYSMFGEDAEVRGLIPRSIEYLFKQLASKTQQSEVAMVCSFLEIYNDQIRDLGKAYLVAMGVESSSSSALYDKTSDIFESLAGKRGNPYFAPAFQRGESIEASKRPGLKEVQDEYNTMNYEIREDAEGNVFVKDMCMVPVSTIEEVMSLVAMGMRVRATHETKMNANSSRSHTVFTVTVLQKDKDTGSSITGMLNLVDLAGSERIKKSESAGVRLKEALHINSSLTALGKVIVALDPANESPHVPFRDSKLTRVLQNSLGGNSYTTVLANICPHSKYYEECLSTLQFANRCRSVRNNPRVNYVADNENKDRKIKKLLEEIKQLRAALNSGGGGGAGIDTGPIYGGGGGGVGMGAGAGGGFQGRAPRPPPAMSTPHLVQLLKKLGLKADLDASGAVVLDGKKVAAAELGLPASVDGSESELDVGLGLADGSVSLTGGAAGAGVAGGSLGNGGGGGGGGGYVHQSSSSGLRGLNPDKMKRVIAELQESNAKLSARTKEQKALLDDQGRQMQELSAEVVKLQTSLKHKEYEYKGLEEERDKALVDLEAQLKANFETTAAQLSAHNKAVLLEQQAVIQSVPETFRSYTALLRKSADQRSSFEGPIRREFERHLSTLEAAAKGEMANLKAQYEHWLSDKDKVLESFVAKFNAYRSKKAEQLRQCEKEIVRLHEYTEQIENILDGVEKGKYQVQQKQGLHGRSTTGLLASQAALGNVVGGGGNQTGEGAVGGVVLPKGLKPTNPLLLPDHSDLVLTRRIVCKHKDRMHKLEKVREEAFHRSLHQASQASNVQEVDPVLQKQIRDLLVSPSSRQQRRQSSPDGRPQSSPAGAAEKHGAFGTSTNNNSNNNNQEAAHEDEAPPSEAGAGPTSNGFVQPTSEPPSLLSALAADRIALPSSSQQRPRVGGGASPTIASGSGVTLSRAGGGGGGGFGSAAGDALLGEVMLLRAEVLELRASRRLEQLNAEKLAEELASDETVQYIRFLEAEQEKLHGQLRDLGLQLKSSKVANAALQRKAGPRLSALDE